MIRFVRAVSRVVDEIMNDHGRATHRAFLNGPLGTVSALDDVLRDLDRLIATRFKDQLDPRAKSTLCDREIHFPPYDANGLQTILRDRAEDAFHDGGLDGGCDTARSRICWPNAPDMRGQHSICCMRQPT